MTPTSIQRKCGCSVDTERAEFIDGEWIDKPMSNKDHGNIEFRLVFLLRMKYRHLGSANLELTVRFGSDILTPDVCMTSPGLEPGEAIPFLCVEVRSPGQLLSSLLAKCDRYMSYGVQYCWIVDPITGKAYVCGPSLPELDIVLRASAVDVLTAGEIAIPVSEIFEV